MSLSNVPPSRLRVLKHNHPALAVLLACCVVSAALACPALAQGVHHPFAVGADEGAVGHVSGLSAWIIAQESGFYRMLTGALRSAKESGAAMWGLIGLSFGYGVFHAAGPGHGKAVIASYMVSNERALRRGLVISLLAAVLQGLVAVGLVGIAAMIFASTAKRMTEAAHVMEVASYAGIVLLGAALLWSKGTALVVAFRHVPAAATLGVFAAPPPRLALSTGNPPGRGFVADDCRDDHIHGPGCGHFHAPDPSQLGDGFSWRSAVVTILTAGARPCSGAILVLVFSLAQGIFWTGAAATFAMSLGTAITTGALASMAVLAKSWAVRFSGTGSWRAEIIGRGVEVAAALCVLLFGAALLFATFSGVTSLA
jgi:nickel/cobalt transporter (NicO) family protein